MGGSKESRKEGERKNHKQQRLRVKAGNYNEFTTMKIVRNHVTTLCLPLFQSPS